MIFVILGTQDKKFPRLLEAIQKKIDEGKINKKEEIIVQAGSTKFESKNMKILDYIPVKEFEELIEKADLIICHAGVGTIIYGLSIDKTMIVAARLKKYGEHVNDHQLQILDTFSKDGYIIPLREFSELKNKIIEAEKFKPKKFISNNKNFVKLLDNEITKLTKE